MGYRIAAYVLVPGTLLVYGLWLRSQRLALVGRNEADGRLESGGERRR